MAVNQSTLSSTGTAGDISGAGDRYVSLSAWESVAQNAHGLGDQTRLECFKGTTVTGGWQADGSFIGRCTLGGWSNLTETDDLVITAAAGEEHGGVIGGGVLLVDPSTNVFSIRIPYVTIQDIEIRSTGNATSDYCITTSTGATNAIVQRCIITVDSQIASGPRGLQLASGVDFKVRNNLVISIPVGDANAGSQGIIVSNAGSLIDNNTVIGWSDTGIISTKDTGRTSNNVAYNNTVNYRADGVIKPTTSASNDGQLGTITIDDTAFIGYTGGDYRPATGGLLDGSVSTTTDLSGEFTDDIIGYSPRSNWEIGAWEIQGAAPGAILSDPTATPSETSALIGCTTDTAGGTLYWYVSTSATAPSTADLKAGTGAVSSGSMTPSLGANTDTATGLTAATQYWHYWIQET